MAHLPATMQSCASLSKCSSSISFPKTGCSYGRTTHGTTCPLEYILRIYHCSRLSHYLPGLPSVTDSLKQSPMDVTSTGDHSDPLHVAASTIVGLVLVKFLSTPTHLRTRKHPLPCLYLTFLSSILPGKPCVFLPSVV